jgi:hypothetical protein
VPVAWWQTAATRADDGASPHASASGGAWLCYHSVRGPAAPARGVPPLLSFEMFVWCSGLHRRCPAICLPSAAVGVCRSPSQLSMKPPPRRAGPRRLQPAQPLSISWTATASVTRRPPDTLQSRRIGVAVHGHRCRRRGVLRLPTQAPSMAQLPRHDLAWAAVSMAVGRQWARLSTAANPRQVLARAAPQRQPRCRRHTGEKPRPLHVIGTTRFVE